MFFLQDIWITVLALTLPNVSLLVCLFWGWRKKSKEWYQTVPRPVWSPPIWLFCILWIVCSSLTGLGLYSIWVNGHDFAKCAKDTLVYSVLQVVKLMWLLVFIVFHRITLSYYISIALMLASFIVCVGFFFADTLGGTLVLPAVAFTLYVCLVNDMMDELQPDNTYDYDD